MKIIKYNFCLRYVLALVVMLGYSGMVSAQVIPGSAETGSYLERMDFQEGINPFVTPIELQEDENRFTTTVFTFSEVVLFSYSDNTELVIVNAQGDTTLTTTLHKDEYHVEVLSTGIYRVFGSKSFTALIGDATTHMVHGWYAVDQSGRGVSTLFNTYMMRRWGGSEKFIIAAYENGTDFTIRNLDTGNLLHAGVLNAGDFFTMPNTPFDQFLQVSASKPVSALSYGDTDYYVPASNGTFAGTMFLGYSAYIGNWTNSITVTAYHDNTNVVAINTATGDTISSYMLHEGQVHSDPITEPTYWRLESDQPVIAANIPFAGWTGNYHYKTRAVDKSGVGAGRLFYMPTIGSRIDVFSFVDGNDVKIERLGREVDYPYQDTTLVFEDNLNAGESYTFSSSTGRYVYRIEGSGDISVLQSNGGAGAEFMPLSFARELPDLAVSTTDIAFDPEKDDYEEGEEIDVTIRVHNLGPVDADNVLAHVYSGDPEDEGLTPLLHEEQLPFIAGESSQAFSFTYTIPEEPEFHRIVVLVDPDEEITESNNANYRAARPIIPNEDLLPPLAVTVSAPGGLRVDEADSLHPNPFEVSATFLNTGNVEAEDVEINLVLFDGLSLYSGNADTSITSVAAGDQFNMNWQFRANVDVPHSNRIQIQVDGSNLEAKNINRSVNVPNIYPPTTPVALTASAMDEEFGVMLNWEANPEVDLAGYMLYFGIESGLYEGITEDGVESPVSLKMVVEHELKGLEEDTEYFFTLRAFNTRQLFSEQADEVSVTTASITSAMQHTDVPDSHELSQNYPNPFNPVTTIRYQLPRSSDVALEVFNMLGQQVVTLVSEHQQAGRYEVVFDAAKLPSGVYLYRLRAGDFHQTRRMLLVK